MRFSRAKARPTGQWNRPSLAARLAAYAVLAFMHLPVLVIVLYAFTTADRTYEFPPPGLTLHWFAAAFARADIWEAMRLSISVAAVATLLAIILGSLTALGMARGTFRSWASLCPHGGLDKTRCHAADDWRPAGRRL